MGNNYGDYVYKNQDYKNLFVELTGYERRGVDIMLNGMAASPMQIVQAHVLKEDSSFMRDYIMNEKGDVKKLCFTDIKFNNKNK